MSGTAECTSSFTKKNNSNSTTNDNNKEETEVFLSANCLFQRQNWHLHQDISAEKD